MIKVSQLTAKNWQEYSSQGQEYLELMNWWIANADKIIDDDYNSSYQSWTKYYRNKMQNEWSGKHKSPKEVLSILKSEAQILNENQKSEVYPLMVSPKSDKIFERKKILKDMVGKNKDSIQENLDINKKHPGVDIENISKDLKKFLTYLTMKAKELQLEKPLVTSGFRSPDSQAKAMAKNWNNHGGINGGRKYLIDLYGDDDMAMAIDDLFKSYGTDKDGIEYVSEYLEHFKPNASPHMKKPAQAVDLRNTDKIRELLSNVQKEGMFSFTYLDEGDHMHIQNVKLNG